MQQAPAHLHRDGVHAARLAVQLPAPHRARPARARRAARHVHTGQNSMKPQTTCLGHQYGRLSSEEINYFHFFALVGRQSSVMCFATRQAFSR